MSLREALENQRIQQAAAKTEDYYRKMFEEVGTIGDQYKYENTLPIQLSPEKKALIDEFVELCPPTRWEKCPMAAFISIYVTVVAVA